MSTEFKSHQISRGYEGKSTKIALPHDFRTALDLVCYQMCAKMPDAAWSGPAGVKLAFRKAHQNLSVNSKANILFLSSDWAKRSHSAVKIFITPIQQQQWSSSAASNTRCLTATQKRNVSFRSGNGGSLGNESYDSTTSLSTLRELRNTVKNTIYTVKIIFSK